MTAYVQKGKAVWIGKASAMPTADAITAITKANPAVVTVTNTAAVGDIIRIEGSGMASLDGRAFEITIASGTSVTITADASGEAAAATTGSAYFYAEGTELVETCFNSFGVTREAGATITAGTFCGTTTLAGQPGATTVEFAGYDDPESDGLKELFNAQDDGIPRVLVYNYPAAASSTGLEYKLILPSVTIAGLNGPVATSDGAATFSGTATSNGKPTFTNNF